jgi:hypothetical protein
MCDDFRCERGVGVSDSPAPFQVPRRGVPIIGEPCHVNAWFPTVTLTCNCLTGGQVLLVGFLTVATCPACARGFQLHSVQQDIRTGAPPHLLINVLIPGPPPEGNGKPV